MKKKGACSGSFVINMFLARGAAVLSEWNVVRSRLWLTLVDDSWFGAGFWNVCGATDLFPHRFRTLPLERKRLILFSSRYDGYDVGRYYLAGLHDDTMSAYAGLRRMTATSRTPKHFSTSE